MSKLLFFLLASFPLAQTVSDYAYTGAKVSAMAGAVVAETGSNWSIFHNPAGITEIEGTHLSAGSGNLFGFKWLPTYNLGGTAPLPVIGKIGFAFQQLETKYSGKTLSKEQTLSLAQGFDLQHDKNSRLAIGYTANFVQWDLGKSAGVSGDGSTVVGWQDSESGFRQAAIWVNGVQQLIFFPNGDRAQAAGAISDDGVWVGGDGNFANNFQAYRWSEATGVETLGPPLQPGWRGATTSLNEDGSIAVGYYRPQGPALFGSGFIWTEALGVTDLNSYAESLGIDTQGIVMSLPLDISADGSTIVGAGRDSNNQRVGFVLKLAPTILGTETVTSIMEVTYYPNPVSDILNIDSATNIEQVAIYSVTGQQLLSKALDGANTVDVSFLSNGVYFVKAFGNNTSTTFKIIKN